MVAPNRLLDYGYHFRLLLISLRNFHHQWPQRFKSEKEKGISDSEIVNHYLEIYGLTKPATPKNSVKENRVKFTRQGSYTMKNFHS